MARGSASRYQLSFTLLVGIQDIYNLHLILISVIIVWKKKILLKP